MTDGGYAKDQIDDISDEDEMDLEERLDNSLPGVQSGDLSKRTTKLRITAKSVQFSPTGRSWAAATTKDC